jgi:hypothetical protein
MIAWVDGFETEATYSTMLKHMGTKIANGQPGKTVQALRQHLEGGSRAASSATRLLEKLMRDGFSLKCNLGGGKCEFDCSDYNGWQSKRVRMLDRLAFVEDGIDMQ